MTSVHGTRPNTNNTHKLKQQKNHKIYSTNIQSPKTKNKEPYTNQPTSQSDETTHIQPKKNHSQNKQPHQSRLHTYITKTKTIKHQSNNIIMNKTRAYLPCIIK